MADQTDRSDLERLDDRDDVVGELVLGVAARRRLAPPEPTQVRADDVVLRGERWKQLAPAVPVLGIPVD
jgi:hypothetical protein